MKLERAPRPHAWLRGPGRESKECLRQRQEVGLLNMNHEGPGRGGILAVVTGSSDQLCTFAGLGDL